jgi:hypothetical protein
VPALPGACDEERAGICLLLAAYEPAPPAAEWSDGDAVEIVRQLARFHAFLWSAGEQLAGHTWLRQAEAQTDEQTVFHAREQWAALARLWRRRNLHLP